MNVICLNGPPKSGKDTIGKIMYDLLPKSGIQKFAMPLNDIARSTLPIMSDHKFNEWRESRKDEPLMTYETTMRKLLIGISEDLIKPQFGTNYFGISAAHRVIDLFNRYDTKNIIFTDSGFQNEYDAFCSIMAGATDVNVHLAQIHREGCNFDNDSREWVADKHITHMIDNNGSLNELSDLVNRVLMGMEIL